jgi:hypothetical protein
MQGIKALRRKRFSANFTAANTVAHYDQSFQEL